jgi:alkanesulfonate monooxygenase SsuD/methylene tetrahydromethanopterin reductase-like flavin-dependent oxidoreductase (luciferase family)
VDAGALNLTPMDELGLAQMLSYSIVGSADVVRQGLERVLEQTAADEIIVASQIFDHAARLRSYEIAVRAGRGLRDEDRGRLAERRDQGVSAESGA